MLYAMAAAEQAAVSMLIGDVRLDWREHDMPQGVRVIQIADDFRIAADRAEALFPGGIWERMSMHEQAEAIYQAMQALDLERANAGRADPTHQL